MAVGGRGARDKSQLIHCTDPRGGWGARVTSGGGKQKMLHFVTRMCGPRLVYSATPQAEIGYFFFLLYRFLWLWAVEPLATSLN